MKPAYSVKTKDTTGAGDIFNGALAAFWHKGLETAIDLAVAASSLSVTKLGAQKGAPIDSELTNFLNQHHITEHTLNELRPLRP